MSAKREGELKSLLAAEMKKALPGFLVLRYSTAGAPDRSCVGFGRQTNWEMKHGDPGFDSPDGQELACARLDHASHCRYVVWQERNGIEQTLVVRPKHVMRRLPGFRFREVEARCDGFDMKWLAEQIALAHGVG